MENKTINFNISGEKMETLKRKVKFVGDIACKAAAVTLQSEQTLKWSAGIGLIQGLKYNGNFKRGLKAGLATAGVMAGINVISNLANNYEEIKKA